MKISLTLLLGVFWWAGLPAHSQPVPYLINYQGRLTDEASRPLANGADGVEFRLWNRAVAGQEGQTLVWGQRYEVSLLDGVFNVMLGAPGGSPLPGAAVNDLQFAFGDAERYLGLTLARLPDGTVVGDAQKREILPRQQLLSAPFALRADVAAQLVPAAAEELVPPGTIVAFGGSVEPRGWLLCDGRVLRTADHPRLWAAIGTAWGNPGDGHFRLPDLRGLFLRGVDNSPSTGVSGRDPDRDGGREPIHPGGNPGNAVGSIQSEDLRRHSHTANARWAPLPGGGSAAYGFYIHAPITPNDPNWLSISETGGQETRPRNAYVNYLIKH